MTVHKDISVDNEKVVCQFSANAKTRFLAQMVACLPQVQQVQGLIPSEVVNFHLIIFNFGARRGGDVHFIIARLYITVLD